MGMEVEVNNVNSNAQPSYELVNAVERFSLMKLVYHQY